LHRVAFGACDLDVPRNGVDARDLVEHACDPVAIDDGVRVGGCNDAASDAVDGELSLQRAIERDAPSGPDVCLIAAQRLREDVQGDLRPACGKRAHDIGRTVAAIVGEYEDLETARIQRCVGERPLMEERLESARDRSGLVLRRYRDRHAAPRMRRA
jgi:hypothetical protein